MIQRFSRKIIACILLLTLTYGEMVFALVPSDIAGQVFHLDAQDVNGNGSDLDEPADNTAVSLWGDPVGSHSGFQNTSGQRPRYQTGIVNGFPILRFAGTSDILEMNDHTDINLDISYAEKSFAFLIRTRTDVLSHQVIYEQSVGTKGYSLQIDGGNLYFGTWNTELWSSPDDYKVINLGSVNAATPYRIIIAQGTTMSGYLNGNYVGNATNVGLQSTHGACIFDTGFGCSLYQTGGSIGIGGVQNESIRLSDLSPIFAYQSNFFLGDIGEIISWNHTLTPAEVTGLDEYLKSHWGFDTTPPTITSENALSGTLVPSGNFSYTFSYTDTGSAIDVASVDLRIYSWNTGTLDWNTTDLAPTYVTPGTITSNTGNYTIANLPFGKYRFDRVVSDTNNNTLTSSSTLYVDQIEWIVSSPLYDIGGQQTDVTGFGSGELIITVRTIGAGFSLTMDRSEDLTLGTGSISVWDGTNGWGYELYNGVGYSGSLSAHGTSQTLGAVPKNIDPNGQRTTYIYRVKYGMNVAVNQYAGDYLGKLRFGINLNY